MITTLATPPLLARYRHLSSYVGSKNATSYDCCWTSGDDASTAKRLIHDVRWAGDGSPWHVSVALSSKRSYTSRSKQAISQEQTGSTATFWDLL